MDNRKTAYSTLGPLWDQLKRQTMNLMAYLISKPHVKNYVKNRIV